ncbi:hypothetical protein RRG08_034535 [Elysia crispata]|uniref:Uncharacterized protein n=1 Tax=Elysia crispata TaxID=231223 RepID=A0AAE1BAS9_9GAST|nr:hypothetical protein RRG08_034535 [Elysia crispata]
MPHWFGQGVGVLVKYSRKLGRVITPMDRSGHNAKQGVGLHRELQTQLWRERQIEVFKVAFLCRRFFSYLDISSQRVRHWDKILY